MSEIPAVPETLSIDLILAERFIREAKMEGITTAALRGRLPPGVYTTGSGVDFAWDPCFGVIVQRVKCPKPDLTRPVIKRASVIKFWDTVAMGWNIPKLEELRQIIPPGEFAVQDGQFFAWYHEVLFSEGGRLETQYLY